MKSENGLHLNLCSADDDGGRSRLLFSREPSEPEVRNSDFGVEDDTSGIAAVIIGTSVESEGEGKQTEEECREVLRFGPRMFLSWEPLVPEVRNSESRMTCLVMVQGFLALLLILKEIGNKN